MKDESLYKTPKRMVDSWFYKDDGTVKILILKSDLAIHQALSNMFFSQKGFSFETIESFDPNEGLGLSLNKVASKIWELCDGTITISEIIDSITKSYSASEEHVREDVLGFLVQCENIKILDIDWRPL